MNILESVWLVGWQKLYLLQFIGLIACTGLPAQGATTYFVDAQIGNDAWSGHQTHVANSDGPWQRLDRVGAASLQPGDVVVLSCNSVWREPLLFNGSGNADAELIIRAQQGCSEAARPEINLALPLNNWLAEGEQVYSTEADFQVKQVFVNGQFLDQSRFPTNGFQAAENGMSVQGAGVGSAGLIDQSLMKLADKDLVGAKVRVRTEGKQFEELSVSALFQSQLFFAGSTEHAVQKGASYYLVGKRWMLGSGPGWFWSPNDKRLYVRLPEGANPSAHRVEATQFDYGGRLVNQPNIRISGIRVRYAGLDGIRIEQSAQITLDNVEIAGAGRDGVAFAYGSSGAIQDSLIRGSGQDGISLWQPRDVNNVGNRVEQSRAMDGPHSVVVDATRSINLAPLTAVSAGRNHYQIGTFYFPGWKDNQPYAPSLFPWEPIKLFPERKPLLGWYDEGSDDVMRQQIDWMNQYGIDFVVFDWYFGIDRKVHLEHALSAYLRAPNRNKLKFSILWANHDKVPKSRDDWNAMVQYWVDNYFSRPEFLHVNDMPVVFVFSADYLKIDAEAFGATSKELLDSAQTIAQQAGLPGIHFVAGTPANVPMITGYAKKSGYASFSGYLFHQGPYDTRYSYSFDELDKGYREHWKRFAEEGSLPLVIPPMTAGWDRRPWGGSKDPLHDNSRSTPDEFRTHLEAAKSFMDDNPILTQRMGVICCWNEFGEGSYIEPTEKMGFEYLEQIRKVFGGAPGSSPDRGGGATSLLMLGLLSICMIIRRVGYRKECL